MARGRSEAAWGHTSSVLAMIANVFRGKGQRPAKPRDFNPLHVAESAVPPEESWAMLRARFKGRT